jgi:hypothetical protein
VSTDGYFDERLGVDGRVLTSVWVSTGGYFNERLGIDGWMF